MRRGEPRRQPAPQENGEQLQDLRRRKAEVLNHKSGDDDWEGVRYRRNVKKEKSKLSREGRLRNTTIFFVSNLPVGCSSNRLWRAFVHFGNLEDAYVPCKLDGAGERNVPVKGRGRKQERLSPPRRQSIEEGFGGSFKQALMGTKHNARRGISVFLPVVETKAIQVWSGKSLIGEVYDLIHMDRLREELVDVRMLGSCIRYVGGLKVMLTFADPELADEFRRLVQKSKACVEDGNISQEKLAVSVKHGDVISREIKVLWGGNPIRIWVHEVEEDWASSFLVPDNSCVSSVEVAVVKDLEGEGAKVEETSLGLLHGLHGLHGGKANNEVEVPMGGNDDIVGDHIGESSSTQACSASRSGVFFFAAKNKPDLLGLKRKRFTADFSNTFVATEGEPGKRKRHPPCSPVRRESGIEVRSVLDDEDKGATLDGEVEKKVEETIRVGQSVGIEMKGFNNQVRKMVQGEKEISSSR
ncbi:hypothetical protein L1987_53212 [Smallanthus sonchifolius]|uniref:Uncharacterized protein n=1 Tax=Smallanthus sonchifolius TaxID=185202 RepID=A0ACB9EVQ5_9ASTR|nr:hypothetical protein L1987_53212 [Smallanthus sonchifolius]